MADYQLVDGKDGFLGRGSFGVVEKVVRKSDSTVSTGNPQMDGPIIHRADREPNTRRYLHARPFVSPMRMSTENQRNENMMSFLPSTIQTS
jgi:hypothetical protein